MKEAVELYSTLAEDTKLRPNGEVISRQEGGPLLFIKNVFDQEGIPYVVHPGLIMGVEILIRDDGEFGKIKPPERIIKATQSDNWIVVSTLLDEWDISGIESIDPNVFLDIQGYVRDGSAFGKKKHWAPTAQLQSSILCMKGTSEELEYVPQDIVEKQKESILISTMGENGLDLFWQSNRIHVPANKVQDLPDTVGAGDTFFSYFIAAMFKGDDPVIAATYATQKTAKFLKSKK